MGIDEEDAQQQQLEWADAQKIAVTPDLVSAARRQLLFLAAVDRLRCLYDDHGPVLRRAIHRYKNCWLPLLAKHAESALLDGHLVVPLDCEWIWHCHRLNPVQYKRDCEQLYGRILDSQNIESTVSGKITHQMIQLWGELYPQEPFILDYDDSISKGSSTDSSAVTATFKYDLIAAVKRQSSFYYQVSRPTMHNDRFLEGAVARYKGFLYLIKRNQEKSMKRFCVPTYDIDLIWHSHQLQSASYCNDLLGLLGRVLEHDDTDSDRSKGKKLDVGFSETTRQWEETFGFRYWRAGAMYRGNTPSPVAVAPYKGATNFAASDFPYQKFIQLSETKVVEVLLEVVGIRNAPPSHKGPLFVSFSKKHPDAFLDGSCRLNIQSETGEKQVANFQCEPTGELVLTLMSETSSYLAISRPAKAIGTISFSFQNLLNSDSELAIEKWFELKLKSGNVGYKPIYLHVAVSLTVPVLAPRVVYMVRSIPFYRNGCLSSPGKAQLIKHWSRFIDDDGGELMNIRMRCLKKKGAQNTSIMKQIVGFMGTSGKQDVFAEFSGNTWSLMDSQFKLSLDNKIFDDGHIFELAGEHPIKLFPGRRLEFEPKTCSCKKQKDEHNFITVVGFSMDDPYGKAVALFNLKAGILKINEDWFVPLGTVLAFILSHMLKNEGYGIFFPSKEVHRETAGSDILLGEPAISNSPREKQNMDGVMQSSLILAEGAAVTEKVSETSPGKITDFVSGHESECRSALTHAVPENTDWNGENGLKPSGCGGGCGGSGGCGGCGGGCGNFAKSDWNGENGLKPGGCGGGCSGSGGCGGCGGGCGNFAKSDWNGENGLKPSGCGGGCGGSGGCGGCGGGTGNFAKSDGAGCDSMCGNAVENCNMSGDREWNIGNGSKASGCGGGCGGSGGCGGCGGGCGVFAKSGGGGSGSGNACGVPGSKRAEQ